MIVRQSDGPTSLKVRAILLDHGPQERPVSLREYVEASLRQKIASGELTPGTRLIERELCRTFDVSRSLIREALRKLEAEKLVTVAPHKGHITSRIDQKTVLELYSVRRLLEGHAVHLFTQRASEAQIQQLGAVVEELTTLVAGQVAPPRLSETKNKLYEIILDGCGNTVLQELFVTLLVRIDLYRTLSFGSPGRPQQACREIQLLFEKIAARDAVAAQAAAEGHIENAKSTVLAALQAKEQALSPRSGESRKP